MWIRVSRALRCKTSAPAMRTRSATRQLMFDMNLVKSLMKSFELQHGGAGPTSNILGEMNLSIPKNSQGSWW